MAIPPDHGTRTYSVLRNPEISIVIRTLNEEEYLPSLLEAICTQKISIQSEIIIVDSGSTDRTLKVAAAFNCRIVHIARHEFSFGRSLNLGCLAAKGHYLVFVSGHCVPASPYWLENLIAPLVNRQVDLTYGRQVGGPSTYLSESRIFSKYYPSVSRIPQDSFFCNNANSAITTHCWSKYKYDEILTGLEDLHLAKKLVDDGGKVGYVAEATVFHYHYETWSQVQRRFEREAYALQKICPELVVPLHDLFRYLAAAISGDIKHALKTSKKLINIYTSIRYRIAQYWGTWCGQDSHLRLTRQLRDSYYYPTQSKGHPLAAATKLENTHKVIPSQTHR